MTTTGGSTGGVHVPSAFYIPEFELQEKFGPSGGPGGQHANRAHTRVELRWAVPTASGPSPAQRERLLTKLGEEVVIVVDEQRSQMRNRELARDRLVERIAGALRQDRPRRATKPTRGSRRRRVEGKRRRGELKRQRQRPSSDD